MARLNMMLSMMLMLCIPAQEISAAASSDAQQPTIQPLTLTSEKPVGDYGIVRLAVSSDDAYLAIEAVTPDGRILSIYDINEHNEVAQACFPGGALTTIHMDKERDRLLFALNTKIADEKRGSDTATLLHTAYTLAACRNGNLYFHNGDGSLRNFVRGRKYTRAKDTGLRFSTVRASPDGSLIIAGAYNDNPTYETALATEDIGTALVDVHIYDSVTGKLLKKLSSFGPLWQEITGSLKQRFHPSGPLLVDNDSVLLENKVWSLTGELLHDIDTFIESVASDRFHYARIDGENIILEDGPCNSVLIYNTRKKIGSIIPPISSSPTASTVKDALSFFGKFNKKTLSIRTEQSAGIYQDLFNVYDLNTRTIKRYVTPSSLGRYYCSNKRDKVFIEYNNEIKMISLPEESSQAKEETIIKFCP